MLAGAAARTEAASAPRAIVREDELCLLEDSHVHCFC